MIDFENARSNMVESQVRPSDVTDRGLLDAMSSIAREAFLPGGRKALAYMDEDVLIGHFGEESVARFLMEPMPFSRLVQAAEVKSTDLVLDVGCATGYSSAVLARIADSVVALEVDGDLAATATQTLLDQGIDNVAVVSGELSDGYASQGPYDVIFVGGSVPEPPQALLDQLKDGGRMVAVVGQGAIGEACVFVKRGGVVGSKVVFDASVPPLPGAVRHAEFVF